MPEYSSSHLKLDHLTVEFDHGHVVAVDDFSLEISTGEFVTLLGPSGAGKTTVLNIVAGFLEPTKGDFYIDGEPMVHKPPHQRDIGMVFQNYALFPHMTVSENIAFPLKVRGLPKSEIAREVTDALALVKLPGREDRYVHQLSGGQKQRVALARAIVFNPSVLLMDEPLGALDKKLREYMQLEVKHIQQRIGITVIHVTHDQAEALTMSDRIVVMNHGKIQQVGEPEELYDKPANRFVADFIGDTNLMQASVEVVTDGIATVTTEKGLRMKVAEHAHVSPGQTLRLALRPERIFFVQSQRPGIEIQVGVVEEVVYLGDTIKYIVRLAEAERVEVKQRNRLGICKHQAGDQVRVGWEIEDVRFV